MTESRRIGILLFLYTRNELSSAEQKELQDWRKKDPENENLFFEMTDPGSLRREMQKFYQERDTGFAKLQGLLPELADSSLSGTVDEAVKIFSEASEVEKEDPRYQTETVYSKSGLSPVEYWGSMISNLDEETANEESEAGVNPVVAKIKLLMPKKRWQRRIVRTIAGIAATWAFGWIYFNFPTRSKENMEEVAFTMDGLRVIAKGYDAGLLAGLADVSQGHTERGELINIVSDQPKRKKDKYYPLITDPAEEHLVLLPDGTRAWINAASTIRYPANFGRDTIKLELDGEVFIEISKNSPHHYQISRFPYSVNTAKGEKADKNPVYKILENSKRALIHALPGARLNFSTYPGNHETQVTMISGPEAQLDSAGAGKTQVLNGMQALIVNDSLIKTRNIDTTQITAWKNGELYFKDATLPEMMPAISKWYDVGVKYVGTVPDMKFTLRVPRSAKISAVIEILQKQGLHIVKVKNQVIINF